MSIREFLDDPGNDTPDHVLRKTLEAHYYDLEDNFGCIVESIRSRALCPILENANVPEGLIDGLFAKAKSFDAARSMFEQFCFIEFLMLYFAY